MAESKKAQQDKADKEAAEARKKAKAEEKAQKEKERKEEAEAKKAAKEEEKREKEEAREKAKKEKEEAKAKARQEEIDSGNLIVDGDTEFRLHVPDDDKDNALLERSAKVIDKLKGSKLPVMGKDLQEEFGGGYPLYIPIFTTLESLGLIKTYRRRTGERGGGGKAYLWVG